jgi:Zn-dependent peptidase ImmA (M78 family)
MVTVTLRPKGQVRTDQSEAWGTWEPHTRTVEIDRSAPPAHQWRTLFHELAHVALDDAGLSNGMHDDLVEAVCDAIATARMRERFG